jgi:putative SOS response-associated peptidase YedK
MCGRFTLHHSPAQIAMRFGVQQVAAEPTERYNIAPTQSVAVITETEGERTLDAYRWGLIPAWAKDPGIANKLINARAETLAEKPSFRNALKRRRCLIPGDGFYEWKKEGNARQPMHIRRKDGELFAFAGLWEEWRQEDGTPLRTCTIITVAPNDVTAPIHDRMPAILEPDEEAAWLDTAENSAPDLLSLLHPYPADWMEAYPVSRRVNAPAYDDPALLNSL